MILSFNLKAQEFSYNPSIGTYVNCPSNTSNGYAIDENNCQIAGGSDSYTGGVAKVKINSHNTSSNTVTFRIKKCDGGQFGSGGKAVIYYATEGIPICVNYNSGIYYVDIEVGTYLFEGGNSFYAYLFSDGGGQYYAGYMSITKTIVNYSLSINPSGTLNVNSSSGNDDIAVTSNVSWTASSNQSWLTITSGSSGSNNGTVNYSYTANTSTSSSRSATITVSGSGVSNKTLTITQAAATPTPTLNINPSGTLNVNSSSGNDDIAVTSNVSWTASSNQSWLTITSESSGSNNGTVSYSYTENTSATSRTAIITVSGSGVSNQTLSLVQGGTTSQSITLLSPTENSNFNTGEPVFISWSCIGYEGNIQFQLVDAYDITNVILTDIGEYNSTIENFEWTVPSNIPSNFYKIKAYNTENGYGTIVDFGEQFSITNPNLAPEIYLYKENSPFFNTQNYINSITELHLNELNSNSNQKLKVLFVYPDDINRPDADIIELIQAGINISNESYVNNEINLELSLCGIERLENFNENEQTAYIVENPDNENDDVYAGNRLLNAIANHSDNVLDNVHNLRDQYSADLVIYLSGRNDLYSTVHRFFIGGISKSYQTRSNDYSRSKQAFIVMRLSNVSGLVTTHEIGHNLNAGHHINTGSTSTRSNHGFRTTNGTEPSTLSGSTIGWATVMAYRSETINGETIRYRRLPYWSNANRTRPEIVWRNLITYEEQDLGDNIDNHNNENAINEVMELVSDYRNEKIIIRNTGTSELILYSINSNQNWLSFSSDTYEENIAISPNEEIIIEPVINWNLISSNEVGTITVKTNLINTPDYDITINANTDITVNKKKSAQPIMYVDYTSIQFEAEATSWPVFVENLGSGDLIYNLELVDNPSWISVENIDGFDVLVCQENTGCERFVKLRVTSSNSLIQEIEIDIVQHNTLINANITDQTGVVGGQINFTIDAESNYELTYQWIKNDTIILDGEINNNLVLSNLAVNNEGYYKCKIGNTCDTIFSNSAFLDMGSSTHIEKYSQDDLISIYPNPAKDLLTVSLETTTINENIEITIFDFVGRALKTIETTGQSEIQINTNDLTNGVYNVKIIIGDNRVVTKKVIIMK